MVNRAKQERIIEAVRRNLEGDDAVEFVCQSGYAMNSAGIARHLRHMGGRLRILELVQEGLTNEEILKTCFPEDSSLEHFPQHPPTQTELFHEPPKAVILPLPPEGTPLYETTKLTLRIPTDVYEALRIAAKAENKPQAQLIIEILQTALAQMPSPEHD